MTTLSIKFEEHLKLIKRIKSLFIAGFLVDVSAFYRTRLQRPAFKFYLGTR